MEMFELTPRYDSRQSFYGKAKVVKTPIDIDDKTDNSNGYNYILFSYDTAVCSISDGKVQTHDMGKHSQTTDRHIKEFILQFSNEDELKRVQKEAKINRKERDDNEWGDR